MSWSILEEDSKESLWPINMIVKNSNICRFFWLRTLSKSIILALLWEAWSCQQSKNILNTFKYQVTPFKKLFQETVNITLCICINLVFAQLPSFQLYRSVIPILYPSISVIFMVLNGDTPFSWGNKLCLVKYLLWSSFRSIVFYYQLSFKLK